jgi:tetratricopeptide (TPR) repeat protein
MCKLFIVSFLLLSLLSIGQNNVYQPVYNSNDTRLLEQALKNAQMYYDKNLDYSTNLINWSIQLKGQSTDYSFNSQMDAYIKELRNLQKGDLSMSSRRLAEIESGINEEVANYNQRQSALAAKEAAANNPKTIFDKGVKYFNEKNYSSAITQFNKVLEQVTNDAATYYYLGLSYYNINDKINAEQYLKKSNEIRPNNIVSNCLGWLYMEQAKYYDAIVCFNKEIELSPNNYEGYNNRGSAKSALNDINGAISDYEKGIELNPDISMSYNNLGWAYFEKKDYKNALVQVNIALQKDSANFVAWDSKAEITFNLKDYRTCIECADYALKLNDQLSNSYFIRGRAKYRLDKSAEACSDWSLAGQNGKKEAYEYIQKYCNK